MNELDGTVRFDPAIDHYIRHNPGELSSEYNAPEYEEISDADFVKVALKANIIEKRGNKYYHDAELIGTKQSDVVEYINNDPALLDDFTIAYHAENQ